MISAPLQDVFSRTLSIVSFRCRPASVTDPDQRKQLLEIRPQPQSITGRGEQGDKYQMVGTFGPLKYSVPMAGNNQSALPLGRALWFVYRASSLSDTLQFVACLGDRLLP